LEEFVGGRKKGITLNRVIGQIKYAVAYKILSVRDYGGIIKQTKIEIEKGKLFPLGPLSKQEMLEKLEEIKGQFGKVREHYTHIQNALDKFMLKA